MGRVQVTCPRGKPNRKTKTRGCERDSPHHLNITFHHTTHCRASENQTIELKQAVVQPFPLPDKRKPRYKVVLLPPLFSPKLRPQNPHTVTVGWNTGDILRPLQKSKSVEEQRYHRRWREPQPEKKKEENNTTTQIG